ncbi:hypothetical protein BDA96_03G201900 [Sorghum bicolor]|uniref:RWP-RK domain-containing protein n=2 Tax=Sorghum bicolor TaxID=4558 RepID=C5XN08_SORBI|nr:hypothetical protein SORBI_3003G186200 [Sorghum bicolor]KAG0538050.1 hypothetical protein BDA96_03G201900 [Sorghum bicolor]
MAMAPCDDVGDADWYTYHVLGDLNLLCSSSSSYAMAAGSREDESFYLPMYSAPPPAAVVGDQYCSDQLQPLPADGALTSLDDALLLAPLSDIDLEAFDNNADEQKKPPLEQMITIPPAVHHHHHHHPAAAGTRAPPIHGTIAGQNAGVVVQAHQKKKAMVAVEDEDSSYFGRGAASGVETAVVRVRHHDEHRQASSAAVALVPPPPQQQQPIPPPSLPQPRARRSGAGDRRQSSAPAPGKTRLDHIGFDELRKYFYMPITRAAREMNVGLTVLKKRCRELGVLRWPHRKMKSLKSLMANVQEMGNSMSPVALEQELAALETYCALMEEDPSIQLTERTKKLRQACFKESYKRRRAAAVSVMDMDHIYSFGHGQHHHHQQPLPPPTSSAADDRHGQQSSRFYGY